MTNMTLYTCRCGELDGSKHCEWVGGIEDLVLVDYMPAYLRGSHAAAGGSGCWPHNGAIRAAIHWECAEEIADVEGQCLGCGSEHDWTEDHYPPDWPDGCTWLEYHGEVRGDHGALRHAEKVEYEDAEAWGDEEE